jgi:hypothetical protein
MPDGRAPKSVEGFGDRHLAETPDNMRLPILAALVGPAVHLSPSILHRRDPAHDAEVRRDHYLGRGQPDLDRFLGLCHS